MYDRRYLILAGTPFMALALAACQQDKAPTATEASGEVLEGTISDDMLPLETVTSQPPPMEPQPSGTGRGGSSGSVEDEAGSEPSAEQSPAITLPDVSGDGAAEAAD